MAYLSVYEMILELQKQGHDVEYRKRKDGGYIITKINDKKYTGAKGNIQARTILGATLPQTRVEQLNFNVQKFIKGAKKKATLDQEMKKELRKVQRKWRKNKVHGRITAKKVKIHIKEEGKEGALEYLKRQERYGEGLAYEENVEYLAQYIEDIGRGIITDDSLQNDLFELARYIRSKKDVFKEEWVAKCYEFAYFIIENNYDPDMARFCIKKIYETIG